MSKHSEIDWVGLWYIAARERGINDINSMGRADLSNHEVEWFYFSHAEMDGAGGLGHQLRATGFHLPTLPMGRHPSHPRWWEVPRIIRDTLKDMKCDKPHWKEQNAFYIPRQETPNWIAFNKIETAAIQNIAKAKGVSLNAFLLPLINAVLLPELINGNSGGKWLFPVNMRGAVSRINDESNQSSAIYLDVDLSTSAENIQTQIKHKLTRFYHWGAWWLLHIGKLIGANGVRRLSRRSGMRSFFLGTFSNMGNWPPPGSDPRKQNSNEGWVIAAPGTPNYPISVCLITWHDKLSLSLKIDPTICADRSKMELLLQQIQTKIRDSLTSKSCHPI